MNLGSCCVALIEGRFTASHGVRAVGKGALGFNRKGQRDMHTAICFDMHCPKAPKEEVYLHP